MKNMNILVCIVLFFIVRNSKNDSKMVSSDAEDSLEGIWVRPNDDSYYSGMAIKVTKKDDSYNGEIVIETCSDFKAGTFEWNGLKEQVSESEKNNVLVYELEEDINIYENDFVVVKYSGVRYNSKNNQGYIMFNMKNKLNYLNYNTSKKWVAASGNPFLNMFMINLQK